MIASSSAWHCASASPISPAAAHASISTVASAPSSAWHWVRRVTDQISLDAQIGIDDRAGAIRLALRQLVADQPGGETDVDLDQRVSVVVGLALRQRVADETGGQTDVELDDRVAVVVGLALRQRFAEQAGSHAQIELDDRITASCGLALLQRLAEQAGRDTQVGIDQRDTWDAVDGRGRNVVGGTVTSGVVAPGTV